MTQTSDAFPHVLVVASDERRWLSTRAALQPRFTLLRARDDAEACDLLQRYAPDLTAVVIDGQLPGSQLDGSRLARLVTGLLDESRLPAYAQTATICLDTPVVLLVEGEAGTEEDGCVRCVAWPPSADALNDAIDAQGTPATIELLRAQRGRLAARLRRANRWLSEQEGMDRLTGVPNRQSFDAALHRQLAQAHRWQIPVSLLFVEAQLPPIEHPRPAPGCRTDVLVGITELLRANLRLGDLCARYGHAALGVLLLGTDLASARAIAERVRHSIETQSLTGLAPTSAATISMGLATIDRPTGPANAPLLVDAAQGALDIAVESGGSRLILADPIGI